MFVYGVRKSVVREVGKKWRRVDMHCTFVPSLIFDGLYQALKEYSVASTYGDPGSAVSCILD